MGSIDSLIGFRVVVVRRVVTNLAFCLCSTGQDNRVNDDFWKQLGGKQPYIDEKVIKDVGEEQEPRLFHGSNASGNFKRT